MIPMRDGIRLCTDIYRPARSGAPVQEKFPILLERTPYGKGFLASSADYFVRRGYVVVFQDVRGRYQSGGKWVPIRDDPKDGFDTAKWLGEQPWSNGSIGTMGSSYDGATQHAMGIANAPYVKAMVPRNAMSDFGRYGVRHNGAFELRWFNWIMTLGVAAGTDNETAAAARAAENPAAAKALAEMGHKVQEYVRSLPLRQRAPAAKSQPFPLDQAEASRPCDESDWRRSAQGHVPLPQHVRA